MNKAEYLGALEAELKAREASDIDEIIAEYSEHFDFKLADGFSESEIAVKLGAPEKIAEQFEEESGEKNKPDIWKKTVSYAVALLEIIGGIIFAAWDLILAAAALAFLAVGVSLEAGMDITGVIPNMPYISAALFGAAALALAVLTGCAAWYCIKLLAQLVRSRARWHMSFVSGAKLPPLSITPRLKGRGRRVFRGIVYISAAAFGLFFLAAYAASALNAHSVEFWHVWKWFV